MCIRDSDSNYPKKNFSADGLLSELKLNDLKDKKICLIKGDDGIDTISKTLKINNKVNIGNRIFFISCQIITKIKY